MALARLGPDRPVLKGEAHRVKHGRDALRQRPMPSNARAINARGWRRTRPFVPFGISSAFGEATFGVRLWRVAVFWGLHRGVALVDRGAFEAYAIGHTARRKRALPRSSRASRVGQGTPNLSCGIHEVVRRHLEAESLVEPAGLDAAKVADELDGLSVALFSGLDGDADELFADALRAILLIDDQCVD